MASPSDPSADRRWTRGTWAAALFALFIAGYTSLQFVSLVRLPTDGWIVDVDDRLEEPSVVLRAQYLNTSQNTPEFLQAGDKVVAVNGEPMRAIMDRTHPRRYVPTSGPDWAPGTELIYRVVRLDQNLGVTSTLDVPVTLAAYDIGAALAAGVRFSPAAGVLQLIASPFFFIVSLLVFLLRPRQPAAHALLHIGTAFLFQIAPTYVSVPRFFYAGLLNSNAVPWDYWMGAILPGLLYLVLAFPTPKWPLRVWPRLTVAAIYLGPVSAINLAYIITQNDRVAFGQAAAPVYAATALTVLVATLISLVHSARRLRNPVARTQLKWMTIGLLSFVVLGIGGWFAGFLGLNAELALQSATLGWFIFPVTLAIAITRYRLFDIDVIIRRTLIYSALTGVLGLAYLGSVLVLQNIFQALTGRSQDQLVTVVSTLAIAVLFGPVRTRVQNAIDHRFYRRKYDAAKTVAAFGSAMRDEVELSQLTDRLLATVETTVQPAHASLWLRSGATPDGRQ